MITSHARARLRMAGYSSVMAVISQLAEVNGGLKLLIEKRRIEGRTYFDISEELQEKYPRTRGFSPRSVERFCVEQGIKRSSRLNQKDLSIIVASAVSQVRRNI